MPITRFQLERARKLKDSLLAEFAEYSRIEGSLSWDYCRFVRRRQLRSSDRKLFLRGLATHTEGATKDDFVARCILVRYVRSRI